MSDTASQYRDLNQLTDTEIALLMESVQDEVSGAEDKIIGASVDSFVAWAKGKFKKRKGDHVKDCHLLIEGDSWFDFRLRYDAPEILRRFGYPVTNLARAGDLLEAMIYGSARDPQGAIRRIPELVKNGEYQFFLFSGGGNDILGPELSVFVDHFAKGGEIRSGIFENFSETIQQSLHGFIEEVLAANSEVHFLMHTYTTPFPDGRAVEIPILRNYGPWMKPVFERKGFFDEEGNYLEKEARMRVRSIVDSFGKVLRKLESDYSRFHVVDVTDLASDKDDWTDELHLNVSGNAAVATRFADKIDEIVKEQSDSSR